MATLEEERRRRRGYRSAEETEAYLDHISRLLARQQGVPKPQGEGKGYYAPPLTRYKDPRDKYAGSAIGSGVANLLGGILQPGRASAIEEMNRQHLATLPQQQAQQSALLTDTQLEGLKREALAGKPQAQKLLAAYMQALKPPSYGSVGSGQSWRDIVNQFGEGGDVGRDPAGSARPRTGDPVGTTPTGEPTADTTAEPVENPYMNMTREAAISAFKSTSAALDDMIARDTAIVDEGLRPRRGRWENLTGSEPVEANPNEVLEARSRLTGANISKNKLLQQIKAAHNWSPAGGAAAGIGGPTFSPNQ
jgi:hypothetical protein